MDAVHSPTPAKGVRKPYLRSYTLIYMPLADIFFPRMYQTPDGFMAVRIQHMEFVIQTDETEFSSEIFLWRECQRHQNPNLGDADCESSADSDAEGIETTMELLRTDYYGQDNTDVLRRFLQPVSTTPKRNGISFFPRLSMHLLNHLFLIKVGLINKKYDSNAVKLAFESYFIAFSEFYRTAIIHFIL
mgnify:CR=1 FL=1